MLFFKLFINFVLGRTKHFKYTPHLKGDAEGEILPDDHLKFILYVLRNSQALTANVLQIFLKKLWKDFYFSFQGGKDRI